MLKHSGNSGVLQFFAGVETLSQRVYLKTRIIAGKSNYEKLLRDRIVSEVFRHQAT